MSMTEIHRVRPTILKEGEDFQLEEVEEGIWSCPFCDPIKKLFTTAESVKEHIHLEHSKKQVQHNGWIIFKCNQECGVLRERCHYHCPTCDKAIISRGDFIFHLKGHDVRKGLNTSRGRKKTLATVMNDEAGLQHIQLFSHASLVVSPTILSLIDDQQKFWNELQLRSGMTCLRDGEEGQQFCVLQGQYDSVIKANTFLERYVLNKLHHEVSTQLDKNNVTTTATASASNESQTGEQQSAVLTPESKENESSTDIRKSGRKRKPNTMLDQYITPKSAKLEYGSSQSSNTAAIRQSTVAQTLKTTVEQECHVTLSKNMQSGEYQVHLMFPPPIITQPPVEEAAADVDSTEQCNADVIEEDNPLAGIDDDDEDEDYKVDPEVENAASEEEMDPEADNVDHMEAVQINSSQSNVMFRCNQCDSDFSSINLLMKHKQNAHSASSVQRGSGASQAAESGGVVGPLHYCKECNFSTSIKQTLKLHTSRTHREKQLECLDCGEKFGPLVDLKSHIRETGHRKGQHTNLYKQMVECKICNKRLQLKNLKSHTELVHDKVKPFSCELCGKMFGTRFLVKEHLESHKNLHERDRPWKCSLCGQAFFKKLPLDEHMAKHMGTPQYQCDQCPKKFYHQSGWKRHLQHHGEERPFHCTVCGKSFKTSTNLSAHKAVHTPMAFMCLCGKSYQQKHTLKYHQEKCPMHQDILANQLAEESYHNNQRYMCGFCQETFSEFAVVQEHVKQHVPDSVQVEANFEGTLSLTHQNSEQQAITDEISGSGLDHLAMTAALEQQNMVTEGRTLIVTDLSQEQLQLVAYPNSEMVDQEGQVLDQPHQQLLDQEGRIIDQNGQMVEQTSRQLTSEQAIEIAISQPAQNIQQVGEGEDQPDFAIGSGATTVNSKQVDIVIAEQDCESRQVAEGDQLTSSLT